MTIVLEGLEDSFDNTRAEEMLGLSIGKITHSSSFVRKSMYDFDLETPEGIEKLMALLPIMDPEILKDIMTEIWPNYPTDIDARRHRLEIKGYLKDYLDSYDEEDAGTELDEVGDDSVNVAGQGSQEDPQSQSSVDASSPVGPSTASAPQRPGAPPQQGTDVKTPVAGPPGA